VKGGGTVEGRLHNNNMQMCILADTLCSICWIGPFPAVRQRSSADVAVRHAPCPPPARTLLPGAMPLCMRQHCAYHNVL
jgi:hypothetical protein